MATSSSIMVTPPRSGARRWLLRRHIGKHPSQAGQLPRALHRVAEEDLHFGRAVVAGRTGRQGLREIGRVDVIDRHGFLPIGQETGMNAKVRIARASLSVVGP